MDQIVHRMVPVTCDDLNEYLFLEILKYLSLLERVRYERVSWKFQTCLATLWKSQKAIGLRESGMSFKLLFQPNCSHQDHQLSANDIFIFKEPSDREYGIKLVKKCPNLLALYLVSPDASYFNKLSYSAKLEHVFVSKCKSILNLTSLSRQCILTTCRGLQTRSWPR